jgi:hypothetical protein
MSTAVLPIVDETLNSQLVHVDVTAAAPAATPEEKEFADPHPLLPVIIFGVIALMLAGAFVGSVVAWLLLRNSGVMAL